MPVITLPFGPLEANCYIVHNGVDAVVFDPSDETERIKNELEKQRLFLRAIALTHLHADHCLGAGALSHEFGLPVFVGREDWESRNILLSRGMCFGMQIMPFESIILDPGSMEWGSLKCQIIHTPGHSAGSLCYYFEEHSLLISGDVLFYRSVGRADLPGGDGDTLIHSLRERLYTLPGNVIVYPGHGPETSIGYEAVHNMFCRA